jgi:GNAT superfamily N-acetyltransferase
VEVRRLQPDDVPAAARVAFEALPVPDGFDHADRIPWLERRTGYLAERDPAGAWVAEEDGEIIGMTNAIVRDGIWGLSMMAVLPDRHARGTGTALLRAALTHAEGTRGQLIMSSQDPKAMRLYARAGFDLLPGISLAGVLDRTAIPAGLAARETEDLEAAAALGTMVRGGAYDPRDLALLLTLPASGALMIEGRGFVVHQGGRPNALVADSDDVATDLLWSALARTAPGGTVDVDPVTAGQDWAIRVGLDAGLAITPSGPLLKRGEFGPLRPWLASGTIL